MLIHAFFWQNCVVSFFWHRVSSLLSSLPPYDFWLHLLIHAKMSKPPLQNSTAIIVNSPGKHSLYCTVLQKKPVGCFWLRKRTFHPRN